MALTREAFAGSSSQHHRGHPQSPALTVITLSLVVLAVGGLAVINPAVDGLAMIGPAVGGLAVGVSHRVSLPASSITYTDHNAPGGLRFPPVSRIRASDSSAGC